jgi:hypothetical protein
MLRTTTAWCGSLTKVCIAADTYRSLWVRSSQPSSPAEEWFGQRWSGIRPFKDSEVNARRSSCCTIQRQKALHTCSCLHARIARAAFIMQESRC